MSQQPAPKAVTDRFLMGHAQSPDWEKAAEQCLQQIGYVPPGTNLGFLYVTDAYANILTHILAHFRTETGIPHWVGTTGMGICASGREYHEHAAMAVMVGAFPEDAFRVLPGTQDPSLDSLAPLAPWLAGHQVPFGIVHGDPRNGATPQLVAGLSAHLGGTYLVGGLSSSHGELPQIADDLTEGGISGVLFSDQVPVATALTQGCTPIAGRHRITACQRNVIATIDDRPALDVFYEDIGEILARDLERVAGYIFVGLPIPGSDTGDYLVRNLVGVDPEHKLLAVGDLLQSGQQVQFCRRDGTTAWEDMNRMLHDIKARLTGPPRGGVYYSCLGRGDNLFGDDSEELKAIRRELGDFPLVGFFANGEISHNRLYGYTGVLTVFL